MRKKLTNILFELNDELLLQLSIILLPLSSILLLAIVWLAYKHSHIWLVKVFNFAILVIYIY